MSLAACLGIAAFMVVADLAVGIRLQPEQSLEFDSRFGHLASLTAMMELQTRVLYRFQHVDTNGDGIVSWVEMKRGFHHEPVKEGEAILKDMLSACADSDNRGSSCTRKAMEKSLEAWRASHEARAKVALLQTGRSSGFVNVNNESDDEELCGPSAETRPAEQLARVKCHWQASKCWEQPDMLAWSLMGVCEAGACICEGTQETKRLAKVGLMGAVAVTSAKDFSDEGDTLLSPACGNGWKSRKIVGRLENIAKTLDWAEKQQIKMLLPQSLSDQNSISIDKVISANDDDTEVALYKSAEHHIVKGGEPGKICMLSWQATMSPGDWKTNEMMRDVRIPYAPGHTKMKARKGPVLAYKSVRDSLKRVFEDECCSPSFTADKIVISGHSLGGALAELHAVDMVTNWECPPGRDLGAKDLAVVLAAPHSSLLNARTIDHVFSCADPAACLSGSVVTLTTRGDRVGDPLWSVLDSGPPRHPSNVTFLPCGEIPDGAVKPGDEQGMRRWWCHGTYNYVPAMETELVGKMGWGSSCGGECGDPNRLVQCNQYVLIREEGCAYANASVLKRPTPCPNSRWLAREERCDCHYDKCSELTTLHCRP